MSISPVSAVFRNRGKSLFARYTSGFTLVELLVAITILALMVAMIASIGSSTNKAWTQASNRITQFQNARNAFEVLTRTLAQATLNTYYTVNYNSSTGLPTSYGRASDLEFVSGTSNVTKLGSIWAATTTGTMVPNQITHAAFFALPYGYTTTTGTYGGLDNLLCNIGFYIQYSQGVASPSFLPTTNPSLMAYRFRLMEVLPPTENFSIYNEIINYKSGASLSPNVWIAGLWPNAGNSGWVHQVASNIIALIISPEDPSNAIPTSIAPAYNYDSWSGDGSNPRPVTYAQLPPVLHIAMVAIDEKSAVLTGNSTTPPDQGKINSSNLFTSSSPNYSASSPNNVEADLATLQQNLSTAHVNFRVFETRIPLRGSKWSSQ